MEASERDPLTAYAQAEPEPLFFLSYARVPGIQAPGRDPDRLVFEFHDELGHRVAERVGVPPAAAGFVPRPGTSPEQAVRALAGCRVFVPLYSQRYFTDPLCGRQWTAFTRRTVRGAAPPIVPVLWTPFPAASVPLAALDVPAFPGPGGTSQPPGGWGSDASAGPLSDGEERYVKQGLHRLLDLEEEETYLEVADRIAARVAAAAVASLDVLSPGGTTDVTALERLPDAFVEAQPRPQLRIALVAPREGHLPPGRDASRYGPLSFDWRPYGPVAGGPVAEQVTELARNLGFAPEVVTFDKARAELSRPGTPSAAYILIVDPWALADPETADHVRAVDAAHRPWTAVLTVFPEDDTQTGQHAARLEGLVESALPRYLREGRIGQQTAARGISTADAFALWFGELAESAYMRYLGYIQPRSSPVRPAAAPWSPGPGAATSGTDEGGSEADG
jgi:FxsC-like protein